MVNGQLRSRLGEHLVVVLIIAVLLVGLVATLPSLTAGAAETATQAQDRMNQPASVLAQLDAAP